MSLEALERELAWLTQVLDLRFRLYFPRPEGPPETRTLADLPPPSLTRLRSPWAAFVREHATRLEERLALVLAMTPHLRPQLLDVFFTKNATFDRRFTEFGGVETDGAFEPTGETLAFVLGGGSVAARVAAAAVVDPEHPFVQLDVLRPVQLQPDQPRLKAPLRVSPEALGLFTTGQVPRPALGADFPAQHVTTTLEWDDLVLHDSTRRQVEEVRTFIQHGATLLGKWGMASRLRPGYRALFYGPPGTGKTLCAVLLGKLTGRDVYRVDLSMVVSKYIGETEKNLARVFDRAQRRGWILFFDEADALFGKRGETRDAHDRYANQEVSYLLQRVETFDGVVILASNQRENLDDAFTRRFESIVYFPMPGSEERKKLWRKGFSPLARLEAGVNLDEITREHELSGGAIINVIRQVSLAAIAEGEREITKDEILRSIRRELVKEGRGG